MSKLSSNPLLKRMSMQAISAGPGEQQPVLCIQFASLDDMHAAAKFIMDMRHVTIERLASWRHKHSCASWRNEHPEPDCTCGAWERYKAERATVETTASETPALVCDHWIHCPKCGEGLRITKTPSAKAAETEAEQEPVACPKCSAFVKAHGGPSQVFHGDGPCPPYFQGPAENGSGAT